ncbi:hypothetical protein PBY51_002229 [Eleginops maclovinus]|uniref:Uncharacterized protein n=1 Tax=Eleginops maclovinus TaxID=56733 RepID=A0AAN7WXI0_ELEMC|nr:hypothetical protein PBY51_002229 [Eleginops maclovinus]
MWLRTCQTRDTAAPTHRREEEEKRTASTNQNRPNGRKYYERQPVKPMGSRHEQADVWCLPMTTIIKEIAGERKLGCTAG